MLVLSGSHILLGLMCLFFWYVCVFLHSVTGRDLAKRRIVLEENKAKTKFPKLWRGVRKGKEVLASRFETHQCFTADVCVEMGETKLRSLTVIFLARFFRLWHEASWVSCLELLACCLCKVSCLPLFFPSIFFWETYSLTLQRFTCLLWIAVWIQGSLRGLSLSKDDTPVMFLALSLCIFEILFQDKLPWLCYWYCALFLRVVLLKAFAVCTLMLGGLYCSTSVFSFKLFLWDVSKLSILKYG